MIKRVILFALIIGGVLYFGMRDDAEKVEQDTKTTEETSEAVETTEAPSTEEVSSDTPAVEAPVSTTQSAAPAAAVAPTTSNVVSTQYNGSTEVTVYLYDFAIDLSDVEIPAGNVTFTVKNTGKFSHNFAIQGGTDFGRVSPGATETFSAYVRPGTKTIYSSNPRDIERGMSETLTVQ